MDLWQLDIWIWDLKGEIQRGAYLNRGRAQRKLMVLERIYNRENQKTERSIKIMKNFRRWRM